MLVFYVYEMSHPCIFQNCSTVTWTPLSCRLSLGSTKQPFPLTERSSLLSGQSQHVDDGLSSHMVLTRRFLSEGVVAGSSWACPLDMLLFRCPSTSLFAGFQQCVSCICPCTRGATLRMSFSLCPLCKDTVYRCTCILEYWS